MIGVRWALTGALTAAVVVHAAGVRLLLVSGNSMAPSIRDGDLVVTSTVAAGGDIGSIILVQRPSDGHLLLHRVVARGPGWRETKGDASLSPDAERMRDAQVLGGLALVIPTGLLGALELPTVHAQFTADQRLAASVTSATGARATLVGPVLAGADALGQLLPGGRATWTVTLTPCPAGLGGECAGTTNTLRIDPDRFAALATSGLARSLRITSVCRPVGSLTWLDSADLFTAGWTSTNLSTGRLASMSVGAGPSECQVQVTLLGAVTAANSVLTLPLRWGPEP